MRMVELTHFVARAASLASGPVTITRYVVESEDGDEQYCVYCVWKLKTRMQSYNAAVVALKTWSHFEQATTEMIRLRSDIRAEVVKAIWNTYPEAQCGMVTVTGIVLKGKPFEEWWDQEGDKLSIQKPVTIDLSNN